MSGVARRPFFLRSPWRVPCVFLAFFLAVVVAYALWSPGDVVVDGRHDRARNGLWLGHAWLGDDAWFLRNGKAGRMATYRNDDTLRALAAKLAAHGIRDVYPHLCPAAASGALPGVDAAQVERFLDHFAAGHRVLPWVGGVFGGSARIEEAAWRKTFCASVGALLADHPRLAGVQVNVEPCPSGNAAFLELLRELRAAMPAGKILSVAAYPPPTVWQPSAEVHWDEAYFRAVAGEVDQLAVMMYDTGIRWRKPYVRLMAEWTREVLAWSEGREVLLGLPAYHDAGTGWHDPVIENLETALAGVHRGLAAGAEVPANFAGVAIYSEWEMDAGEWDYLARHFARPGR
jgi:hypothetical protein